MLRPRGQGRQDHEVDELVLIHWVVNIHITNFASGVSLFVLLVGIGVVVIAGGVRGAPAACVAEIMLWTSLLSSAFSSMAMVLLSVRFLALPG